MYCRLLLLCIILQKLIIHHLSENYGEDLLSLHDAEINHLKEHYEVHKEMFEGVNKWEENWNLFLELDVSKSRANKIYCAHGIEK